MAWKLRFLALLQLASCYNLFESPFELPDLIPQSCREALSRDINCPFVISAEQVRDFNGLNSKAYDNPRALYCADPCRSSLGNFLDNVVVSCGDFKDGLWENISEARSTMEFTESILWAQDLFCFDYKIYPTSNSPNTKDNCKGTTYTVQKGDTCESISKAMSVATDRLIERNGLTYTCSDLLEGRSLCIEDACEIARVEQGQTCQDFVKWKWFSTIQLQSWNPTLKPLCNSRLIPNLDAVAGRYICIGPPGDIDNPEPSHPQPMKGKWRIEPLVSAKPLKTTVNSAPITTEEPWKSYKTRLPKIDVNSDDANSMPELLKYCWLTDGAWDYTLDSDGPPQDCQGLMDMYCTVHLERPSPTAPSSIPETCTPGSSVDEL
ncbi:hypothetical protein CDV36_013033 [Fusarium kuroshium]|uniref:LysM domain-containing protein n=1 Tax=Fusarium kuroshium TaxID=2010991 RepID=A0A3M2RQ73_9HYPO|nr:hypothetical protein CDV36_013033 [Fusarium kuroshium]